MKRHLLSLLARLGYDLIPRPRRDSLEGVLANLIACGLKVETVIDVGAAHGDFTRAARRFLPDSRALMIEPLSEYDGELESVARDLGRCERSPLAASDRTGTTRFNVHEDLVGSSLLREAEGRSLDGTPREVGTERLDNLVKSEAHPPPYLLKIDVQGGEAAVLTGSEGVLPETAAVLVEVSFLPFFDGAPLAGDIIGQMSERGFALHDLYGLAHRPLDGALAQADLVFVPKESPLRSRHAYASPAQRAALTARLNHRRPKQSRPKQSRPKQSRQGGTA